MKSALLCVSNKIQNPFTRKYIITDFNIITNLSFQHNTTNLLQPPYCAVHILPMLLVCFGDQVADVRDATAAAAKAVMGQLSAQGVKLVLPALMKVWMCNRL